MQEIDIAGAKLEADPSGALWWPARGVLVVADLHLEKGSAFAARTGQMLPPYDSRATLARLGALALRYAPKTIVCLGDNFHDAHGPERLDGEARKALIALMRGRRFVWIEGNHDAAAALVLGGESAPEIEIGGIVFRHEALGRAVGGELSGHWHPVASVETRARRVRRRCFVGDGLRCVLPAFGSYTGGLDIFDPAIASLFDDGFTAYLLGRGRVYPFNYPRAALGPQKRLGQSSAASRRKR